MHTKHRSPPIVEDPFCRETKFCRGRIPFYNLPSPWHWIFWGRSWGVSKISQVANLKKKFFLRRNWKKIECFWSFVVVKFRKKSNQNENRQNLSSGILGSQKYTRMLNFLFSYFLIAKSGLIVLWMRATWAPSQNLMKKLKNLGITLQTRLWLSSQTFIIVP